MQKEYAYENNDFQKMFNQLKLEEDELQVARFSREDGWKIGNIAKAHFEDIGRAAIEVELCGQVIYSYYPEGTTENNALWIARKRSMVHIREMSSLRAWAMLQLRGQTLSDWEMPSDRYAALGGGIPIHLKGTGIVGTICASGLSHTEDHHLVITCLKELIEDEKA